MSYSAIRESLLAAGAELQARFEAGESVVDLVHARASFLDGILVELWREHIEPLGAALVAVGGSFFFTSCPVHFGHSIGAEVLKTNFSNSFPHCTHVYS